MAKRGRCVQKKDWWVRGSGGYIGRKLQCAANVETTNVQCNVVQLLV